MSRAPPVVDGWCRGTTVEDLFRKMVPEPSTKFETVKGERGLVVVQHESDLICLMRR